MNPALEAWRRSTRFFVDEAEPAIHTHRVIVALARAEERIAEP
jgi:hypothetical protein